MTQTSDIIVGIVAFIITLYGGISANITTVVFGILLVFITIALRFKTQEEDISLLKSEINTHYELKKVWMEIERLQHAKSK